MTVGAASKRTKAIHAGSRGRRAANKVPGASCSSAALNGRLLRCGANWQASASWAALCVDLCTVSLLALSSCHGMRKLPVLYCAHTQYAPNAKPPQQSVTEPPPQVSPSGMHLQKQAGAIKAHESSTAANYCLIQLDLIARSVLSDTHAPSGGGGGPALHS